MNKNFAIVLSCAVTVLGLASCGNKETDLLKPESKTHTVVFDAQAPAATETKTALHLQVIPDWRNTDVNDVHIFEKETTTSGSYMMEASRVLMETNDDYTKARFYAEFDNASVIVNPPVMETKASSSQFNYTAIMATREGDKYMVPSVQYPHEQSLIDPKADFLVGGSDETYNETLHEQTFLLDFLRPVALARLAITNLEGTKVNEVKITTANYITGFATYDDVDFENKTVEFQGDESNKVLTLLYPEGKKKATTFYAYFVCMPGEIQFSEIKVYTDQYVFTKTYASPASLTLKGGDFMNIALDMTPKDNNGVTKTGLEAQTLTFNDNNEQPVVEAIEYDIYEHDGIEAFQDIAPQLIVGEDVVDPSLITFESSNEDVATVDEEGVVTLTGTIGEATITAKVPGDATHAAGSASYKIIVTDSTPAPANPKFYKADELVDGQEYIIVSNGMAMTLVEETTTGTKANVTLTLDAVEVNAIDGVIETDENVAVWTAFTQVEYYDNEDMTTEAGHFALKNGNVYLQRHSDKNTNVQTLVVDDIPSTGKYYVWDYDGQYLSHLSNATITFYVGYNDGWGVVYDGTLPKVTLYTTTKPLTKQTIAFAETIVQYDLNGGNGSVSAPEWAEGKAPQTTVTYATESTIVSVNESTGEVTVLNSAKKGDTATITATAEQTEVYASAKATYTIEILDSSEPQPTGTTYTLVTKQADVVNGEYLIVASDDAKIFDGTGTYHGGYVSIASEDAISIDGTKITITGETSAYDFTFAKSGDGFTITGAKGMIVCAANGTNVATSEETYITFAETGGSVFIQRGNLDEKALLFSTTRSGSSDEFWYYHKDNGIFKIGGSGNKTGNGIHLYFAGERTAQSISFGKTEDTYDMASEDPYAAPTLSGEPKTQVNYSSSDTSVATVDANGAVTIVGKGETTITATAPASSEYLSATASYTLTVTNSKVPTYYKVDELENGQKYLIVSNGYALALNGTTVSSAAVTATETEGEIKFDEQDNAIWTATVSGTSIKVKNGNNYLRHSSGTTTNFSISTTDSNNGITYDADNNTVKLGSNYLYYSSGFKLSASAGDTHVAAFYSATKPLPKWEISYDVTDAEYDLYTKEWNPSKPILTSAATDVTYSSSAEDVATVSSTGEITAIKSGSTTITATAAADDTHKKATASFVLTVVNSDPDLPKYTKVTSTNDLTVGAKYLIVYEGTLTTEGDNVPKVFNPVLNDAGTQFAKATSSALTTSITNSTIDSDAFNDCQFTLESGYYLKANKANMYIYPGTSGSGYNATSVIYAEATASHALNITFDNGIAWILNGERYLVWSTSNHYFSSNTKTSSSATGICLYKLEGSGGSTPEPPTPSTNPTYTLIEGSDNLVTGTYVIADKTDTYLFNASGTNNGGYGTIGTTTGISKSETTITLTDDIAGAYEFVFTVSGDNLTIKQVGGTHAGQYMFASADVGNTYIGFKAEATNFTINSQDSDLVYFRTTKGTSTTEYLYKKAADSFFKLGGSGAPGGSDAGVYLYKKN